VRPRRVLRQLPLAARHSPSQHATKHAEGTGHPVTRSFEPGEEWFYDYRSGQFFRGPHLAPPTSHPQSQPAPGPEGRVPANWEALLNS